MPRLRAPEGKNHVSHPDEGGPCGRATPDSNLLCSILDSLPKSCERYRSLSPAEFDPARSIGNAAPPADTGGATVAISGNSSAGREFKNKFMCERQFGQLQRPR